MRAPLFVLFASVLSMASMACEASVKATAPNVANPVLLGPIDRVGGHRATDAPAAGTFTAILEDGTAAVGTPVGTTSMTTLGHDPKNVSFWILSVTRANRWLDAHIERVSAGGGCVFALVYGSCNERAELVGRVTKHAGGGEIPPSPPGGEGAP